MLCSQKIFDRTVNKECLVIEPLLFENQLNCCEVRELDDDHDDDNRGYMLSK